MSQAETRQPFFFGAEPERLFGCFHPPAGRAERGAAVLICGPVAQEYIRSHRTLLQLAVRLCRQGYPVLRFDYFGQGDSAGDRDARSWERWHTDIGLAIEELRRRSRKPRVCVVGLRLGATLAWEALEGRDDVEGLVLWEPVIDGGAFVQRMDQDHEKMLRFSYVDTSRTLDDPGVIERLGFPWHEGLFGAIQRIDLGRFRTSPVRHTLVLDRGDGDGSVAAWAGRLEGAHSSFKQVEGPAIWSEEPYKGLVPNALLEALVGWVGSTFP